MREIKFRAWDKDEYRMIHSGTEQNDYPFSWSILSEGIEVVEHDGTDWNTLRNIEIMQYTGLKDKNGTEIYEGDIVRHNEGRQSTIVFEQGAFQYHRYGGLAPIRYNLKNSEQFAGEIVGNIYENPELLEA